MSIFRFEKVRSTDEAGRLVAAGSRWTESIPSREGVLLNIIVLALGVMVLSFFSTVMFNTSPSLIFFSPVVAVAAFCAAIWLPGQPRSLFFHADGRISAPDGLPSGSKRYDIEDGHHTIASLEARRMEEGKLFAVMMVSFAGDLVKLSINLREQEAFKVSVQLTHALDEMRVALADGGTITSQGAAVGPDPSGRLRLID